MLVQAENRTPSLLNMTTNLDRVRPLCCMISTSSLLEEFWRIIPSLSVVNVLGLPSSKLNLGIASMLGSFVLTKDSLKMLTTLFAVAYVMDFVT